MATPLYQLNTYQRYKAKYNVDDIFKLKEMAFAVEIALNDIGNIEQSIGMTLR